MYVVWWNYGISTRDNEPTGQLNELAPLVRLDQNWALFTPQPSKDDGTSRLLLILTGWIVIPGNLADGSKVDLFTGMNISFEKPESLSKLFPNHRYI